MLGGGSMDISTDKDNGQKVGSHVRMRGKVFGLDLSLDEVITRREPPRVKEWTTIGTPRLIIIGYYRMKVNLLPQSQKTLLRVAIDYSLPEKNPWPGKIFGGLYASWCVRQMIRDTGRFFEGFSTSGI
ncbi:MAG: hypothetical protein UX91_C0006G0205 [Candidatus Amesbacteria bacterium GW2011_GWB1_47_19]|nr:MAG: hypothetical protein UW51_C0002G0206 [Candidatus Amesbacteria bacterium GW2011_GWA1_44_24]KKU30985.1 MAG: hypothetical protein UX46_C0008G0005 [Candidatus Amesbacteria bacterium GW2011_GWC1_46_24]KKU67143.1 MAG: hypothetical protein UX91_C0006G0205 [Candidatus Amesbacteria bacterium GW2011_GWB1_47_19]